MNAPILNRVLKVNAMVKMLEYFSLLLLSGNFCHSMEPPSLWKNCMSGIISPIRCLPPIMAPKKQKSGKLLSQSHVLNTSKPLQVPIYNTKTRNIWSLRSFVYEACGILLLLLGRRFLLSGRLGLRRNHLLGKIQEKSIIDTKKMPTWES